uniref:CD63 antigen n=1 Tax=Aceria tosichella TaxID=561515 RepID=A0A6G1SF20_9ACAR
MAASSTSSAGGWTGPKLLIAVIRAILYIDCVCIGFDGLSSIFFANRTKMFGDTLISSLIDNAAMILMVVICPIGIHATFTRDPARLKMFAWMILALALCDAFDIYSKYIRWNTNSFDVDMTFKMAQHKYEWYHNTSNGNNNTKWLDEIQTKLACCGSIDSYKEWASVRQGILAEGIMPIECCQKKSLFEDGSCHYKYSNKVTCLDLINGFVVSIIFWLTLEIVGYIVVVLFAFAIAKPTGTLNGNAPVHGDQSERFDESVYVHEPAQQAPFQKQKPPTYSTTNVSAPPVYSIA